MKRNPPKLPHESENLILAWRYSPVFAEKK